MNAPARRDGLRTIRTAPLVPVALAATLGIVLDRYAPLPFAFAFVAAVACLAAGLIVHRSQRGLALGCCFASVTFLAAWYAHFRREDTASGELARLARPEGSAVRLVARLAAPPAHVAGGDDPLLTIPRSDATRLLLDVDAVDDAEGARPARGAVLAYVPGKVPGLYPGDELEVQGRLVPPTTPSNPGEADRAQDLRDEGIAAVLSVPADPDAVRLRARRWPHTLEGWLGRLHHACKQTLHEQLTAEPALATALLLGDGSGMSRPEWERYIRSGVVHALAISGQHLVVLGGFLRLFRRLTPLGLRTTTILVAVLLLGYALLTGGRPPVMRAAFVSLALGAAVCLHRPLLPLPTLALAWLGVALLNPADLFQIGCQLSFLAVLLLHGVLPHLDRPRDEDPLDKLIRESRPLLVKLSLAAGAWAGRLFLADAVVWLGLTPLLAARFHSVAPAALLIGPPVVFLTSIALLAGFLLLLTVPVLGPLAAPFAWVTDWSLRGCEALVDWSLHLPGAYFYLADLPEAWLWLFYAGLFLVIYALPRLSDRTLLFGVLPAGATALLLGLGFGLGWWRHPETRVTFLAVGHGGCTVLETASGRVLVYDAGSMAGPDLTRRVVAPYLWSRGVRHIDDLLISHADLDHFNGVPALLERFAVGRVSLTPSFADRPTPGVRRALADLRRRGIAPRTLQAGDRETVEELRLDVLHPPPLGPEGKENARSLVLRVRVAGFSLLLTGDLEEAGLEQVLALRPPGLDILMAPHHGSRTANTAALAAWARPRIAVSCQGRPRGPQSPAPTYEAVGAVYLTTWQHGALTLRREGNDFRLEAFRSKERWHLGPAAVR